MRTARVVSVVVCVVVAASIGAGGVAGVPADVTEPRGPSAAQSTPGGGSNASGNATNFSLGSHVSSFMQSSAARTAGSVDTGMWVAAYARAESNESRAGMVRNRTDRLADRLADLRERKRALRAAKSNGTIGQSEYLARLGRLVGRLAALSEAIDETGTRAAETGVNRTALARLRANASELSGGEVSAIARNLSGNGRGPPAWLESVRNASDDRRGPPGSAGNATEGVPGKGNRTADNATRGAGNATGKNATSTGGSSGTGDAAKNTTAGGSGGDSGSDGSDSDGGSSDGGGDGGQGKDNDGSGGSDSDGGSSDGGQGKGSDGGSSDGGQGKGKGKNADRSTVDPGSTDPGIGTRFGSVSPA